MKISAKIMNWILIVTCLLMISLTITVFVFGLSVLSATATVTDHAKIDAELASDEIETITQLKSFIDNNPELVGKTNSVIASAKEYQYQDEVLRDIQRFASESGVRIQSFTFESTEQAAAGATPATPTPATPTTPAPTIPGITLTPPTLPSGVKTANASLTLARPLTYTNLLRFIKRMERSPTQFNIQPMTLQVDPLNRSLMQSTTIELKVFTK